MHSLRWVCEKVASATTPPTKNESPQGELAEQSRDAGDYKDESRVPATPTRSPSRQDTGRSGDSGYHTATSKDWQARFGSDESTPSNPAKQDQRLNLEDGADQGRERHDSLLSPIIDTANDTRARSESTTSSVSRTSSVSCSFSDIASLHEQVIYNDDTDECEVVSSSGDLHRMDLSSEAHYAKKQGRVAPPKLPSRKEIITQLKLDLPISNASPFWRVLDGIDPPQILQQVSCLQCVLKGLPCDERLPQCSRCIRSGHGPCLVQRELLAEERWKIGLWGTGQGEGYTVMVRLPQDDHRAWALKTALEEMMLEYLQEQLDERNWSAPVDDGNRGLYRRGTGPALSGLRLSILRGHTQ